MEQLLGFALVVIVISSSGVLSPGPLFTANIFYGLRGGAKNGLKMTYGHTVVELPLIILLGIGIFSFDFIPHFRTIVTIVGSLGLFTFAGLQLKHVLDNKQETKIFSYHGPFLAGIFLSAFNPFFVIWWLTIGLKLISDSIIIWSIWGIFIMFLFHIWMDYAWLISTAFVSSKISRFLSAFGFKLLVIALSVVLVYFGITFLIEEFY